MDTNQRVHLKEAIESKTNKKELGYDNIMRGKFSNANFNY